MQKCKALLKYKHTKYTKLFYETNVIRKIKPEVSFLEDINFIVKETTFRLQSADYTQLKVCKYMLS